MNKYIAIWYNYDQMVKTDIVEGIDEKDAERNAYLLYDGNPPAELVSIIPAEKFEKEEQNRD